MKQERISIYLILLAKFWYNLKNSSSFLFLGFLRFNYYFLLVIYITLNFIACNIIIKQKKVILVMYLYYFLDSISSY